ALFFTRRRPHRFEGVPPPRPSTTHEKGRDLGTDRRGGQRHSRRARPGRTSGEDQGGVEPISSAGEGICRSETLPAPAAAAKPAEWRALKEKIPVCMRQQ